jgi:hypothetical protein
MWNVTEQCTQVRQHQPSRSFSPSKTTQLSLISKLDLSHRNLIYNDDEVGIKIGITSTQSKAYVIRTQIAGGGGGAADHLRERTCSTRNIIVVTQPDKPPGEHTLSTRSL